MIGRFWGQLLYLDVVKIKKNSPVPKVVAVVASLLHFADRSFLRSFFSQFSDESNSNHYGDFRFRNFPSKRYGWLSVLREKRGSNDQKWGLGAANWWPDKTQPSQISVRRQIENFIHREIRLIFQIETNGFIHIFVPLFYLVGCEETRFHFWCWTLLGRALRWCCWLLSPGFKTLSWLCCWRAFIISNSLSCDVQTFVLEGFQGWRDSWILSSQRVCNWW